MDIRIEAIGHANQTKLNDYYTKLLAKKYARYSFVKTVNAKVQSKDNLTDVKLILQLEKAGKVFSSDKDENENRALQGAIKKMNVQIEKYKEKHYA